MTVFSSTISALAQSDVQGYSIVADEVRFHFSESLYNVEPTRVVVTGDFRGWSSEMEEGPWTLRKAQDGDWYLNVSNKNLESIPPGARFKFRINDGEWLDPPAEAANVSAGNLVFLQGVTPPRLRAEIRSPRAIWVTVAGIDNIPSSPDDFSLEDARGNRIPVVAVVPNSASELLVVPSGELDIRRVYYLEIGSPNLRTLVRRDPWFRTLYSTKVLGANVSDIDSSTTFRLFAPRASQVVLFFFDDVDAPLSAQQSVELTPDSDGVWEISIDDDLTGTFYEYAVYGPDDPGDSYFEATGKRISDPYARVSVDSFGPSRVARAMTPATPLTKGRPAMKDVVAYEVHVQDFTDALPVESALKGTFAAMAMPGLRNELGEAVGLDYLADLGINAVHLMPVQEYLHYPDAEWQAAFSKDPFMKAQEISLENYQWGYRTTHAFAVESRYRVKHTDYGTERGQFRDLVQAYHDRGIAVLIDLVPNHTGENMDGREYLFTFNGIDRPYYYRTNDQLAHIGPFGNEIKTEDRPMVQRWIIDQCLHFINEYGVDGFRIDLAGQIDEQTLKALRRAVGDEIIIYGEPWIAPSDPDVVANPDWSWYKEDAPITYFQDAARDAFKGPPSNPQDKYSDRGFAGGNPGERDNAMMGLLNSFPDEIDPVRGINYLDIHDNWALADRFASTDWNGLEGVDEDRFRIAATLLLTSLGPVVLHGGTEIMRSKGSAPLEETIRRTASGPLAFHGKRDTYNLRFANRFNWNTVGQGPVDNPRGIDYKGMHAFWRGLIQLRTGESGRSFRVAGDPPPDYYKWILPKNKLLLGYLIDDRILVLINASDTAGVFDVASVIQDTTEWQLVARGSNLDLTGLENTVDATELDAVEVASTTIMIWLRIGD